MSPSLLRIAILVATALTLPVLARAADGAGGTTPTTPSATASGSSGAETTVEVFFSPHSPTGSNGGDAQATVPPAASVSADDLALSRPLDGSVTNVLRFPQMQSVHVRMWVPRTEGDAAKCADEATGNATPLGNNEVGEQSIENRIYDFASLDDVNVRLPNLQYEITYCFQISGLRKDDPDRAQLHRGYLSARVSWPLRNAGDTKWWADRYVMPSVGIALTCCQSWGRVAHVDAAASPFVFVGVHMTPWPTDRRIAYRDRVHGGSLRAWAERFHIELAAAVTNPWPNTNVPATLGIQAAMLGAGFSFGDNLVGLSLGLVAGHANYHEVDTSGIGHDRSQTLLSPTFNVSTQFDVVAVILGLTKGQNP